MAPFTKGCSEVSHSYEFCEITHSLKLCSKKASYRVHVQDVVTGAESIESIITGLRYFSDLTV